MKQNRNTGAETTTVSPALAKLPVSRRKLFVEAFINVEKNELTESEIKHLRKKGVKQILDGEYWFKVAKEYSRLVNGG